MVTQSVMPELLRFAKINRNPELVKRIVESPSNLNPNAVTPVSEHWYDLGMCEGYPCLCVFYAALDHLFPEENWDNDVHNAVVKIKESIDIHGIPSSTSIFSGIAGLCYSLRLASRKGSRYQKMISKLDDLLLAQVESLYIAPLQENLSVGKSPSPRLYELIRGLAGTGLYFLQNLSEPKFCSVLEQIISTQIALTHPIKVNNIQVPGWHSDKEHLFLEQEKQDHPNGVFNMGLSHGIPGVLGFLSIAKIKGIELPGQREAIQNISQWLCAKRSTFEGQYFYKAKIDFEEEIEGKQPNMKTLHNREAWCYGTPGVARSLYLAGKALQDEELKTFAIESFSSIFRRPKESWKLPGPIICHGYAGLLLLTHFMAKDAQDLNLMEQAKDLRKTLWGYYDAETPFGFCDMDLCKDNSYVPIHKSGLLTGAMGVWLTLLTTEINETPSWYYHLLVNDE